MDKYAKLIDAMRQGIVPPAPMPIMSGLVKAVDGESCTVLINDVELTDVRLKATINGSANSLIQIPKTGSYVLVGSLTGDLKDLCVLKIDELEKLQYEQDGVKFTIDSTTQKVTVSNDAVNLKDIFQELANLLKAFVVLTPVGPSSGLLPNTLTAIDKFESDFKLILN